LNGAKETQTKRKPAIKSVSKKHAGKGKRKEKIPPHQYVSSDGLVILVGRNNLQNDWLTFHVAAKDDLWLHVQKIPGSHVIIRTNQRPVPDRTLEEAASIAAYYSQATRSTRFQSDQASAHKVAVDYCPVSHVRKPPGARPGMVIYNHHQTLLVTPALPDEQNDVSD
ncbi:MAG: DUF814 domain-containing protein, partial [Clostridia bacterium]|nr:DUF814 domain-containing protein [Clostridia bacterium]